MKDQQNKKRRVLWIRSSGKWAEIWFEDGNRNPDQYDESCKWYMLTDLIEASGLDEDVMQRGHVGLWLLWEGDRPVAVSREFLHNQRVSPSSAGPSDAAATRYPRRGNPKDCEFWWYRQSPQHLWAAVMVFWGMEIMERCGNAASFPINECPGEWIGPISSPNEIAQTRV